MSAARGTAPAFQLYASDLLAKRDFRMMTFAERGLLLSLWCECWVNSSVPSSPAELTELLGKEVAGALTPRVLSFFQNVDGSLQSPDLEAYRAEVLQRRATFSEAGRKGGKKRIENERKSREASSLPSSHPSTSNQASLKPAGSEIESEIESETALTGRAINHVDDPWVRELIDAEMREHAKH